MSYGEFYTAMAPQNGGFEQQITLDLIANFPGQWQRVSYIGVGPLILDAPKVPNQERVGVWADAAALDGLQAMEAYTEIVAARSN